MKLSVEYSDALDVAIKASAARVSLKGNLMSEAGDEQLWFAKVVQRVDELARSLGSTLGEVHRNEDRSFVINLTAGTGKTQKFLLRALNALQEQERAQRGDAETDRLDKGLAVLRSLAAVRNSAAHDLTLTVGPLSESINSLQERRQAIISGRLGIRKLKYPQTEMQIITGRLEEMESSHFLVSPISKNRDPLKLTYEPLMEIDMSSLLGKSARIHFAMTDDQHLEALDLEPLESD